MPATSPHSQPHYRSPRRRSALLLAALLILWSFCFGWLASWAIAQNGTSATPTNLPIAIPTDLPAIGTVDPIPANQRAGQAIYLDSCTTCHIAIPPAVLPSETWRDLLLNEEHYGVTVPVLPSPQIYMLWEYLQFYSRPNPAENETIPYRLDQSQYFTALHPGVDVPRPVKANGCISCHAGAEAFNFREY